MSTIPHDAHARRCPCPACRRRRTPTGRTRIDEYNGWADEKDPQPPAAPQIGADLDRRRAADRPRAPRLQHP